MKSLNCLCIIFLVDTYDMMGESQRDITPEKSAAILREQSIVHHKSNL